MRIAGFILPNAIDMDLRYSCCGDFVVWNQTVRRGATADRTIHAIPPTNILVLTAKMLLVFLVLLFFPVVFKADMAGRGSQLSQGYADLLDTSMVIEATDVGEREVYLQLFNAATNDRHTVVETVTAASLIIVLLLLIGVCGCVVLSPHVVTLTSPISLHNHRTGRPDLMWCVSLS